MAAFEGGSASFNAFASGVPAPSHRWQKGTNGVYVNLSDGSRISGSQSGSLSISTLNLGDLADYICIATNVSGVVTSDVVRLTVVSTNVDVTMPGDPITGFGDISVGVWANTNPTNAINDINTAIYQNGGSGLNAQAGFPPFSGPVGLIVTPSVGSTRVVGLRIYTAGDTPGRDPADYKLEGSNDGGASYTIISSGSLALPDGRADNAQIFDPTVQPMQEILFANNASYTSYRLTFEHLKNDNGLPTVCLQIGEIELLGVAAPPSAVLSISVGAGGTLTISSTVNGQLYSTTNLTASSVWKDEGPITGSVVITPQPGEPTKFYQMR
jgi:hypothetical protein